MMILAEWIDVFERLAIPLGILIGVVVAWKLGAFRAGYQKGKEQREKRGRKP